MAFKLPEVNMSNVIVAVVVAIVAIKFRAQIIKAFGAVPFVGPAVAKFATT